MRCAAPDSREYEGEPTPLVLPALNGDAERPRKTEAIRVGHSGGGQDPRTSMAEHQTERGGRDRKSRTGTWNNMMSYQLLPCSRQPPPLLTFVVVYCALKKRSPSAVVPRHQLASIDLIRHKPEEGTKSIFAPAATAAAALPPPHWKGTHWHIALVTQETGTRCKDGTEANA
ncbi:hypothetical protein ACCO45_000141 [Purpureocillium lilacinum]|uniref:Uncharacterized protein n=1 Tax=Purpureocillium lilacinum TaxID=33203 RepID=A0ACC4E4Q4_PURLI